MPARMASWAAGSFSYTRFSSGVIGRSLWGTTHGGVRWKTVSSLTSGWMRGMSWMADAPVPTTATRSFFRLCVWSHWAEW